MLRAPALGVVTLALATFIALPALAAGLAVTVSQVDVSSFPKVRVALSVADSVGVPITGLDAQAFELKEDDQVISPIRVDSVVESQESVATALISFSDQVKVVQPYTSDRGALKAAIAGLQPGGDTALYDAIAQTAQLQGALPQRRKILLLLTDGADTRSKQSVETTIAAAQQAGVVVFAIGLGDDVNRDVLDQLAGSAGQAVYVSDPAQLRETFLSIGDRLRRQYVLEYTSKTRADDKQHALAIKVNYRGQVAETRGSFGAPKVPLVMDIRGITNAAKASGVQRIDVTIASGEARQVELLVDDQSRGIVTAPPFTFQWDTLAEKPGIHKVVVRGTDVGGAVTDKELVLEVRGVAPPPPVLVQTPAPAPAVVPVARSTQPVW